MGCPRLITADVGTSWRGAHAFSADHTQLWMERLNDFALVDLPSMAIVSTRNKLSEQFRGLRYAFDDEATIYYYAGNAPSDAFSTWSILRTKKVEADGTVNELFTEGVNAPMPWQPYVLWTPYDPGNIYRWIPTKGLSIIGVDGLSDDLLDGDLDHAHTAIHDGPYGGIWFYRRTAPNIWDLVRWDIDTASYVVALSGIETDLPQVVTGGGKALAFCPSLDYATVSYNVVEADGTDAAVSCSWHVMAGSDISIGAARWDGKASYFAAYDSPAFDVVNLYRWPGEGWSVGRIGWRG